MYFVSPRSDNGLNCVGVFLFVFHVRWMMDVMEASQPVRVTVAKDLYSLFLVGYVGD